MCIRDRDWGDGTPNTVTAYQGMPYEKGMDLNKDPRLCLLYTSRCV